jgi:predicted dehydrogenase
MNEEFRWGIISTGGIAQQFAKDLTFLGNHRVGAVGSRTRESAEKFAATYGGTAYGSYEELVKDPNIDGVYVATPHPYHVRDALLALNAGKPVLCEKPFAISAAEARQMVTAAQKKNVLSVEAMWTRFLPHIAKIRSIIESGAIGKVHTVEASHCQNLYSRPNPRFTEPALGGGALNGFRYLSSFFLSPDSRRARKNYR